MTRQQRTGPGRTDEQWYAADGRVIADVEKWRFFPQVTASGSGGTLTTPEGRELLDLSVSLAPSAGTRPEQCPDISRTLGMEVRG